MTWVKLDDHFDDNEKVVGLSDAAFRLYVEVLCFCARKETDGRINKAAARGVGSPRAVKELVSAGLWIESEACFEVKDYLAYNPSHAKLEERRAGVRGRMKGHRGKNGSTGGDAGGDGVTDDDGDELSDGDGDTGGDSDGAGRKPGSRIPVPQSTTTTAGVRATLGERLQQPSFGPGNPPPPRKDPLGERMPFHLWFPSTAMLSYLRSKGLSDADVDATLVEARDGLTGRHDFEWFDIRVWRYFDVAIDRKANPRRPHKTGPDPNWPTDDALRLREAIRAGREGKSLQAKERAGNLDYVTALRLSRERNADIAERAAERRPPSDRPPPGLAADVPGGSLTTLTAGIGRTIT